MAESSPLVGVWWLYPADPERCKQLADGYGTTFWWGDTEAEPDWISADEIEFGGEPVEWIAERFVTAADQPWGRIPLAYTREERRRWFGLTEHEWECEEPEGSCDPDDWACACGVRRADVGHLSAPWDEHCQPEGAAGE